MRLDPLGQNTAEDIAPAIVGRRGDPGLGGRGGKFVRSPCPPTTVASRLAPAWRSNASATVTRSGAA